MGFGNSGHNLTQCFGVVTGSFFGVNVVLKVSTARLDDEFVGCARMFYFINGKRAFVVKPLSSQPKDN